MARNDELKILTRIGMPGEGKAIEGLFVGVFKDQETSDLIAHLDRYCPVKIADLLKSKEVTGNFKEFHVLHLGADAPIDRIVLIGLGKESDFDRDTVRSAAAKAARTLRRMRCKSMAVAVDSFGQLDPAQVAEAVVEGAILGLDRYPKRVKQPKEETRIEEILLFSRSAAVDKLVKPAAQRGVAFGEATNRARNLANEPSNLLTPKDLVACASELAKRHGRKIAFKAFGEKQLEKMGAGGILAVGQGSSQESFLIDLEYKGAPKGGLSIALVGKGVTFDTGGISIKPSGGMHQMKYDMSGAAAVLGALDVVATLGLPVNLNVVVPTAENMPGGNAYKPGDVLKMLSGHYVEVLNTDAEGRLLLADGLWYAAQKKPDLMIDAATLTGAIIVALGHSASGVFSNRKVLPQWIQESGSDFNEKYWHMPLFPEYGIHISSTVADVSNDGGRPAASSSAALFLKTFVDEVAWAHLDIAGTAWIEESSILYVHKPYLPKRGATGFGVRSMANLVSRLVDRVKAGGKGGLEAVRKELAEKA